jgi:hypothetical protein
VAVQYNSAFRARYESAGKVLMGLHPADMGCDGAGPGEMSEAAYATFLEAFIRLAVACSADSSIHYIFIDWRHLPELLTAARPLYAQWMNLLVWNKSNAGQGSFYRSKHELIAVFTPPRSSWTGLKNQ